MGVEAHDGHKRGHFQQKKKKEIVLRSRAPSHFVP